MASFTPFGWCIVSLLLSHIPTVDRSPRASMMPPGGARCIRRSLIRRAAESLELFGNSRPLTQHYDRYLPVGLPLILRVGWVLFDDARPQPRPLVPLRPLRDHRTSPVSELDAHMWVCPKV